MKWEERGGRLCLLEGNAQNITIVTDVWDPPPFFPIPSSPLSHFLWDMITNNEGISSEIWDQFIGGNVLSIAFWRLSPLPLFSLISFSFWTYLYHCQHDYASYHFTSLCLHSCVSMVDVTHSIQRMFNTKLPYMGDTHVETNFCEA